LAFTTLFIANLGLILSNRFWSMNVLAGLRYKNTALLGIIAFNIVLLSLVIYMPFLRDLFRFTPLHLNDLATCFGAGMACVVWFEMVKYFGRRNSADCLPANSGSEHHV
jgi:Ca2+-transporting ATPase